MVGGDKRISGTDNEPTGGVLGGDKRTSATGTEKALTAGVLDGGKTARGSSAGKRAAGTLDNSEPASGCSAGNVLARGAIGTSAGPMIFEFGATAAPRSSGIAPGSDTIAEGARIAGLGWPAARELPGS